jgi:hypothetical protein
VTVRPSRWIVRISLLLVIAMGLFGYWVAMQSVQMDLADVQVQQPSDDGAWIELLATLGEEALQLFLGFAAD